MQKPVGCICGLPVCFIKSMEKIKQWLLDDDRDYRTGVFLYMEYGVNARLSKNFMSYIAHPTTFISELLIYELRKICPVKSPPPEVIENPYRGQLRPQVADPGIPLSPTLKKIPSQAKSLHKEHSYVHELMRNATTDEERLSYAHKIMSEIIPALDAIYRGDCPPEIVQEVPTTVQNEMTDLDRERRIRNLIAHISKTKSKIKSGRTDLDEKLSDLIAERDHLISEQHAKK